MRFLGNIEAKTDAKGRVFLPATFRKVLQASGQEVMVMRKDAFQDCLTLYPESVWNEQLDMLRLRLNRYNRHHQEILRQFVSDAERIELDGNGRFLIGKRYLQMAGIDHRHGRHHRDMGTGKDRKTVHGCRRFRKGTGRSHGKHYERRVTRQN